MAGSGRQVCMMYVATLAPTIAFGGLLQDSTETFKTDPYYDASHVGSYIGITETMFAQGVMTTRARV